MSTSPHSATAHHWKNPAIAEARDAALSLLKPTDAQLEHGLALHEQATVVESYGFSAFAAPDTDAVHDAVERGANFEEARRVSVRGRMSRMADDPEQRDLFEEAWRAAGVTCVLRNSGEEGNDPVRMLERLSCNIYVTDQMPDFMMRALTPDDIREAKRQGRHCFYLTTNGVPLPQQWRNVEDELHCIETFFRLGVRMMHLTYNRRNMIGDGCAELNDGGLSDFGRAAVAEMNRVGVIVDGAHSSGQTCLDAAKCASKPVVISHATCRAMNDHVRAHEDHVIKAVAETGGYMGICCLPPFLGGSGDVNAFLDHVDHAVKLVGPDHVAIGTDVSADAPYEAPSMPAQRRRFENFWPAGEVENRQRYSKPHMRKSLAWTNWPLFTVGLVQRGYRDQDIEKILGGNVLRVAQAVLEV